MKAEGVSDFKVEPIENLKKPKMELEEDYLEERRKPKPHKGYSIYKDYEVMLNLTDVVYGVQGHNKFYKIYVLKKNEIFHVKTTWGRVGMQNP